MIVTVHPSANTMISSSNAVVRYKRVEGAGVPWS